ncbi:MAG: phosphoribosylamine--glycine ligase [Polyangia bacterium]
MGNRILLVGSGGREHALAWKLLQSPLCDHLVAAPGNPGIEALGRGKGPGSGKVSLAAVGSEAVADLVALAEREHIDFVVCGPEAALAKGLGDAFAKQGIAFFGPSQAAAEIEGSKKFAKDLMKRAGVPSAAYGSFSDFAAAEAFIDSQPGDVVVKADGLCAGKGVVVANSHNEAKAAARAMLLDRSFGDAGARVVIEERLTGRECSMMALCDGERFVLLATAEDHKAVFDGDRGPNTGGMGAYSPSPLVDEALTKRIARTIFAPTVAAMAAMGRPFRGLLYGGLMLTPDRGPMVIEWNCRFGDPETQAVLPRMEDDLLPWLLHTAQGNLPARSPTWSPGIAVCVVLAAAGYPGKVRSGDAIDGLAEDGQLAGEGADLVVFHAGTKLEGDRLVTSGGRVLGVTARGADLDSARSRAYGGIARIQWNGMHVRKDIGLRGRT